MIRWGDFIKKRFLVNFKFFVELGTMFSAMDRISLVFKNFIFGFMKIYAS